MNPFNAWLIKKLGGYTKPLKQPDVSHKLFARAGRGLALREVQKILREEREKAKAQKKCQSGLQHALERVTALLLEAEES